MCVSVRVCVCVRLCVYNRAAAMLADGGLLPPVRTQVVDKALLRLRYENLDSQPELATPGGRWFGDPAGFAIDRFACVVAARRGVCRRRGSRARAGTMSASSASSRTTAASARAARRRGSSTRPSSCVAVARRTLRTPRARSTAHSTLSSSAGSAALLRFTFASVSVLAAACAACVSVSVGVRRDDTFL